MGAGTTVGFIIDFSTLGAGTGSFVGLDTLGDGAVVLSGVGGRSGILLALLSVYAIFKSALRVSSPASKLEW